MAGASRDVVVVGGGVIGLSIAWRATQRGLGVTVVDPAPGRGASHVAGGMLAPVTEAHYGEEALLRLNLASAERYEQFAAELAEASGVDPGYRTEGTLAVALDADDKAALDELAAYQRALGLAAEPLTGRECRRLEPMLAPSVRGGVFVAGDHSIDNRRLVGALLAATERAGVRFVRRPARSVGDGAVRTDTGTVDAGAVVVAAGCWSGRLVPGLPARPVKGQILRLRVPAAYSPFLARTVRGLVAGGPVYLVPRADGELVLGATMEEQGFDTRVTAGGAYELLRDAHLLVPGLAELELAETIAGLRPGSPDNAPLIGRLPSEPHLIIATGHGRNGILLAPVTADAVAEILATGDAPPIVEAFAPSRFGQVAA